MRLSRHADYGVRAMVDVASLPSGERAITSEVAHRQDIPRVFLTKIIPRLVSAGLLRSYRGEGGGIILGRSADTITLLDVVEALDGPIAINRCTTVPAQCDRANQCAVHEVWLEAQHQLRELLGRTLLSQVAQRQSSMNGEERKQAPGVKPLPTAKKIR